ncbi:uncharacterized protein LOC123551737 [Mercenaria mercenaria]|uniref:uncharacterized protein LOC123551737 n=1 Tax=Mercenaria mercenaria TaxID=6596 RepID=UPI00234EB20B|nr:uncharacterized protein LOC123551737 [Mercenaria mercenaria]
MDTYMLIFLLFYLPWSFQELHVPEGFLGCVLDRRGRVLKHKLDSSDSNCGDECKRRCMTEGFRYAGTKFGVECYCGNTCKNYQNTTGCNIKCPGNTNEFCGSRFKLSLYDTRIPSAQISATETFSSTTKASTDFVHTAVFISVPVSVVVIAVCVVMIIICWRRRRVSHSQDIIYDDTVALEGNSGSRVEYDYSDVVYELETETGNIKDYSSGTETATLHKKPPSYDHITKLVKQRKDKNYSHLKELDSELSLKKVNGPYLISSGNMQTGLRVTSCSADALYCNASVMPNDKTEEKSFYRQTAEDDVDLEYDHVKSGEHIKELHTDDNYSHLRQIGKQCAKY